MINRVLDLQNLTVRQITVPLSKTVRVDENAPVEQLLALFRERGFSRLPVTRKDGESERIVGLVNLRSMLYEPDLDRARPAREFLKPALYLGEDLRLELALRRMQEAGQRLAMVLGGDGREIGIISLQDILRVIFGEKFAV
jgi:CBS domain containing-hemolysin-like protein